ncbi:transposase [Echinicola soli]|uniref:Transposase n=1 Tax=Echinicola soli TaxID=2591634 RepID=A0A514CK40_9BACT|nr:transposase [Echinicola soli]QDH80183.1 transposase [Echinicola soli]
MLGIDETSSKKGHRYVTVAVDMEERRVVHAYLSYEQRTNPFEDPYDAIRQYSMAHGVTDGNALHHEFMPAYVSAVASSLQRWDANNGGGNLDWSYYEAMAWGGLTHHGEGGPMTEAFKANFPNKWDRDRILKILANEATGNGQAKGDKCD